MTDTNKQLAELTLFFGGGETKTFCFVKDWDLNSREGTATGTFETLNGERYGFGGVVGYLIKSLGEGDTGVEE